MNQHRNINQEQQQYWNHRLPSQQDSSGERDVTINSIDRQSLAGNGVLDRQREIFQNLKRKQQQREQGTSDTDANTTLGGTSVLSPKNAREDRQARRRQQQQRLVSGRSRHMTTEANAG